MANTNMLQKGICEKWSVDYFAAAGYLKVGISLNVKDGIMPINGMRYMPVGDESGWYIWAGEQFSDESDFFVPLHIKHIKDWNPNIIKYLGLPPGFRFLFDDSGYEDVWQDNSLLIADTLS